MVRTGVGMLHKRLSGCGICCIVLEGLDRLCDGVLSSVVGDLGVGGGVEEHWWVDWLLIWVSWV